ncbi:MAG: hypothetical protein R3E12_15235 [Candidatus Eisenbacteria bacterium]|uniref:DUF5666 domain-containing protein n=1 Tax=Eiseniibacteriota bacterium TaxID=2212470 RepID=A0A956M036_UNCEI|nr:hypothetical protein [Candidatus Eisenbacteria bacterium]
MSMRMLAGITILGTTLLLAGVAAAQTPLGTDFTYQGQLNLSGAPVNGTADFQFKLFGAASGGTQIGSTVAANNVTVVAGVFTVTLDFGTSAFQGDQRWIETAVRSPAGSGAFATLSPRQKVAASPYALKVPGVDGHSLDASDGNPVDALTVDANGRVGIGTANPVANLQVETSGEGLRIEGNLSGAVNQAYVSFSDVAGTRIGYCGDGSTGDRSVFLASDAGDVVLNTLAGRVLTATADGRVGVGTTTPNGGLHVKREPLTNGGTLELEGTTHAYMSFFPGGAAAGRRAFFGFPAAGTSDMTLWNENAGGNINLVTTGGGVTRINVLEIVGADLAEKFPTNEVVEPGMVVMIDPTHDGQLCLAEGAYNHGVAGVVSGANDFSVGAVLGNLPGSKDAAPVALSGRVYVWCDAASGPIERGDFLTTSETPGHAMKAVDLDRARGAILGKAMTCLPEGRGLVLVLVNLQ